MLRKLLALLVVVALVLFVWTAVATATCPLGEAAPSWYCWPA